MFMNNEPCLGSRCGEFMQSSRPIASLVALMMGGEVESVGAAIFLFSDEIFGRDWRAPDMQNVSVPIVFKQAERRAGNLGMVGVVDLATTLSLELWHDFP
jgi:hypothetical protein